MTRILEGYDTGSLGKIGRGIEEGYNSISLTN